MFRIKSCMVGRAGRDGLPARGILLFDEQDKKIQRYFISSGQPSLDDFERVINALKQSGIALSLMHIKQISGLHPTRVTIVLAELIEQAFLIKRSVNGRQVYALTQKNTSINLQRYERQNQVRSDELASIMEYGHNRLDCCLMSILRLALGDKQVENCGQCGQCLPNQLQWARDIDAIKAIELWLENKNTAIDLGVRSACAAGLAVFDSKLRAPLFLQFMRQRAIDEAIDSELWALMCHHLLPLQQQYQCKALVVIPSRTWKQREALAQLIAAELKIPLFLNNLEWAGLPDHRQGECSNNDQRKANVDHKMVAKWPEAKP